MFFEVFDLRGREHVAHGIHVAGEACFLEQTPAVAAGDVVKTAVFLIGIIEANPAGEVSHRLGPRPIRKILMPCHHAAVLGGLAEELIVEEPEIVTEQLPRWHEKARVPQNIMKRPPHSPSAERVKEHSVGIVRFVAVIFVKQLAPVMLRIGHLRQFPAQHFNLSLLQQPYARYVAVFHEMRHLIRAQLMRRPFLGRGGSRK